MATPSANPSIPVDDQSHQILPPLAALSFVGRDLRLSPSALQFLQQIYAAIAGNTGLTNNVSTLQTEVASLNTFIVDGVVKLPSLAFAALPTGQLGMLAVVNDSVTNVWGDIIAGGGGFAVLAFFDGGNWVIR